METIYGYSTVALLFCMAVFASAGRMHNDRKLLSYSSIPKVIAVPSGNELQLALYGVGFQHYSFNGSSWVLQNATADLYSTKERKLVGKHFFLPTKDAKGGQPSWETFQPQSLVTAKSNSAVTVDPNSITWNLLSATFESGSKNLLGAITYVQRTNTEGGLPPSSGKAKVGTTHATPYSATYSFYVKAD